VCVIDADRRILSERVVEHSGTGLLQLVDWLIQLTQGNPDHAAIAIETPRGPVVELLVERGFHVFAVNPKQLDRFRDRHTVAGAKDDRRDAFVLADSLRTDEPCFRRVTVEGPLILQLRELSRVEEDLRQEANRLHNRLREQLHRFYPQLLHLSPAADEPWFWDLVELASTPEKGARLGPTRIAKVLQKHRIRKLTPAQILTELRAPALQVAPGAIEAAAVHVALLLPRLRLIHQQRAICAVQITGLLQRIAAEDATDGEKREHRDVQILQSLPGVGRVVTATMLAEASRAIADRDYHALRALAGIAPVTRRSGKRSQVVMRHGCNTRLRNAFYHWARVSAQHDPHSRATYVALRRRGHNHGRALRSLADSLLRVLIAMLRSNTLYDPRRSRRACAKVTHVQEAA
jgi:transposase